MFVRGVHTKGDYSKVTNEERLLKSNIIEIN
jgi:hypothetical protein